MTVWRWTLWTVSVFAAVMMFLLVFGAKAAPHPQEPPRRASDIPCVRHADPGLAVKGGRIRIARDRQGCVRWRQPTPMVRAR